MSEGFSASKDANGIWVATPTMRLTPQQRMENKIKRKLERGETLSGPFAASGAGLAEQKRIQSAQDARIKQLEDQVAKLLAAQGAIDPKTGQLKTG